MRNRAGPRHLSLLLAATALGGFALAAPSASAFKLLYSKYDTSNGPILYVLDEAGSADISDGSDLEAVRSAMTYISESSCGWPLTTWPSTTPIGWMNSSSSGSCGELGSKTTGRPASG